MKDERESFTNDGSELESALRTLKNFDARNKSLEIDPQISSQFRAMAQERWTPPENTIKILLLGEGGVGALTLALRYVHGKFISDTNMTISPAVFFKNIELNDKSYCLHLWRLPAQERFRFLVPNYVQGARGAIFVYDMGRRRTLYESEKWVEIARARNKELPILLCGTKTDLSDYEEINTEELNELLGPTGFFAHVEVSSKTGANMDRAFEMIARKILNLPILGEDVRVAVKEVIHHPEREQMKEPVPFIEVINPSKENVLIKPAKAKQMSSRKRTVKKEITPKRESRMEESKPPAIAPAVVPGKVQEAKRETPPSTPKGQIIEKLQKIMQVSTRIELARMQKILQLTPEEFNDHLIDWAIEFGFKIDGEYAIFQSSVPEKDGKQAAFPEIEKTPSIQSPIRDLKGVKQSIKNIVEKPAKKVTEKLQTSFSMSQYVQDFLKIIDTRQKYGESLQSIFGGDEIDQEAFILNLKKVVREKLATEAELYDNLFPLIAQTVLDTPFELWDKDNEIRTIVERSARLSAEYLKKMGGEDFLKKFIDKASNIEVKDERNKYIEHILGTIRHFTQMDDSSLRKHLFKKIKETRESKI